MIATEADLPLIVELGREAHAASSWATVAEFNATDFEASCRLLMGRDDSAVFVCDRGSIWMTRTPLYFNHAERMAIDVFYYATRGGDALRREAQRWAGPGLMALSRNHATSPRLSKLYSRAGFAPAEHQYVRRL